LSSLAFSGHLFGFGDDVCVPTELRVAVNPSIMDALERAPLNDNWVSRFEQQGGACHATHLYVYPVDDLVMANALSVDWGAPGTGEGAEQLDETSFQTIGPDPDVWIPSTFLAVESARNAGSNRLPGATPSLGTSPLVALVPPAAARRLPTPLTAAALAKTLTADASSIGPLALRRPATDAGGGLAALVALYSGLTGKPIHVIGDLQPHRAQLGRLESRTVSTSCSSEDIRAQPPIVTLMPKNLVQVQGCSQSGAVRPVDTPFGRLDYPYVALNDPTSPSPERRRAAGSLLSFLTGDENAKFRKENNRLDAPAGSRPTAPVGPVVAAREQFRPNTDLLIAVDVSASMQTKVASFGNQTRAAVAHGAIDQALRLARSGDRVGLWEFADGHRVVAPFSSAETAEEKSRLLDLLNRRRGPLPPGTALYATIAAGNRSGFPTGAEARPTAARVILLITDGKDEDPPPAVTDAQAAASLNGQQIRVFLLSIGGEACAGKPSTPGALSRPTNLGPRVECLPVTTSASLTAAVDQVSAELWGR
jgi:Mg-chelatase subunit ChlD